MFPTNVFSGGYAWLRDVYTQYRMPSAILRNFLYTDSKIQFVYLISMVFNERIAAQD